MWLDHCPAPSDTDADVTLNVSYHASAGAGAEVGVADPAETSELGWFAPDELPPVAFPTHAEAGVAAWREAVRDRRAGTPPPPRPLQGACRPPPRERPERGTQPRGAEP